MLKTLTVNGYKYIFNFKHIILISSYFTMYHNLTLLSIASHLEGAMHRLTPGITTLYLVTNKEI